MKAEYGDGIICESITASERYSRDVITSRLSVNECVEIDVIVGGVGVCRVLNEVIDCKTGDLFLFNPGIPHGYFVHGGTAGLRRLSVSFDPEIFTEANGGAENAALFERVFKDGLPYSCSVLNSEAMGEICRIFGMIRKETEERGLDWERAARAYLSLLLITLERYVDLADTVETERPREWSVAFSAMSEVMRSYSDPSLTLGKVAERLYVSRSRLSRAFLKVTGESFPDYLRGVRIREACALLEGTDMTNEEIARECGFRDLSIFYEVFKRYMDVTPYIYRKNCGVTEDNSGGSCLPDTAAVAIAEISACVQKGRVNDIGRLIEVAIAEGVSVERILNDGLICGMTAVGERFKKNEVYVPEVLVAARVMNLAVESLRPLMADMENKRRGRVCIGTVQGDLHDIGKNLVKMMMEGKGLEVIDLGTDVSPDTFIRTAIEKDCRVICCSALLTTTMHVMAEVVKAAEDAGIRDKVRILIGGAPVSESFCTEIGADRYTSDAVSAAEAALEFCLEKPEYNE